MELLIPFMKENYRVKFGKIRVNANKLMPKNAFCTTYLHISKE